MESVPEHMIPIILLTIGGITLTVGDILFKFWVESPRPLLYVFGLGTYLIGLLFLVQSFKYQNIAVASVTLIILNVATLALVSWLQFGEKLSFVKMVGIAVAFLALILLQVGK